MMRESTPALIDLVRKIDRLRMQLESTSSPSTEGAIRNEIARLLQLAGANITDFQFMRSCPPEKAPVAVQSGYVTMHPSQAPSPPPRSAEDPVSGGGVPSLATLNGLDCLAVNGMYQEPSEWEQYLMRVLDFDSLQKMEDWMNSPTAPAVLEKSGATQEEELEELLASILEIENQEDRDVTRSNTSIAGVELSIKNDSVASLAGFFSLEHCRQKATSAAGEGEQGRRYWYNSLSDSWARGKTKRYEFAAALVGLTAAAVLMITLYLGASSLLRTSIMLYLLPVALSGCFAYGSIWLLCALGKGAWKLLVDGDARRSNDFGNILALILSLGFAVVLTYFSIKTLFYWVIDF
jgi:hypothetical protein